MDLSQHPNIVRFIGLVSGRQMLLHGLLSCYHVGQVSDPGTTRWSCTCQPYHGTVPRACQPIGPMLPHLVCPGAVPGPPAYRH